MGLKAWFQQLSERVWPARIAPFVEMIAAAIEENPGEFAVQRSPDSFTLTIVQRRGRSTAIDQMLVDNGVAVRLELEGQNVTLVTYYFDDIQLNWRERLRMLEAVVQIFDAYEDAAILSNASGSAPA